MPAATATAPDSYSLNLAADQTQEFTIEWITDRQGDKVDNCPALTTAQEVQLAKVLPLMGSGFYFVALINEQVRLLMEYEIGEGGDFDYPAERFAEMAARQMQTIYAALPMIRESLPTEGLVVGTPPATMCFGGRPTIWITVDPEVATSELVERLWQTTGEKFRTTYKDMHPDHPLD